MATDSQITANRENSKLSTGPKTPSGIAASSQNNLRHGLAGSAFALLSWENPAEFEDLKQKLLAEHQPATATETLLVENMAQHQWLSRRALTLQTNCLDQPTPQSIDDKKLALFMRYQAGNERAFYKALTELQKLRKERTKHDIGFEQKKALEAAEARAAEIHRYSTRALERKDTIEAEEFHLEHQRIKQQREILFGHLKTPSIDEKKKAKPRT